MTASGTTARNATTVIVVRSPGRRPGTGARRDPIRSPNVGTSSSIAAVSSANAGKAGMIRRQKLPDSIVATSAAPFTTTNPRSHTRKSAAAGIERRATATVPASGRNWTRRPLQVNSRRFDMFCFQVSKFR